MNILILSLMIGAKALNKLTSYYKDDYGSVCSILKPVFRASKRNKDILSLKKVCILKIFQST
jgi:hypothetical protein